VIESHQHDLLCEGLILHHAEHPGSSPKQHFNSSQGSGHSGHCRRRIHVYMKSHPSRKVRKIHRKPVLTRHFSERVSSAAAETVQGACRGPWQALRCHSSRRKACCCGKRHPELLLNFFFKILTRALNYCQDLHQRMFLELLLLPN